jgi:hypothetical protein
MPRSVGVCAHSYRCVGTVRDRVAVREVVCFLAVLPFLTMCDSVLFSPCVILFLPCNTTRRASISLYYAHCSLSYLCVMSCHVFRAVIACRDGRVYNIKDGDVRGSAILTGNIIDAGSQIVAIAKQDKVR